MSDVDPVNERLYTVTEVHEMFQVTEWTVRQWVTKGKLKSSKINGRIYFTEAQIRDYANGRYGE